MRQSIRFVLYAGIIIGVLGIFIGSHAAETLDEHILLEYTHPDYFQYFNTPTIQYIPEDLAENGLINQIENSLTTTEYDAGFTITVNDDGSLTYSGTNQYDRNAYVWLTNRSWRLHGGTYVLSDSQNGIPVSTDDIKLCVMAQKYHVGGETEYVAIADMTHLESVVFTTDYEHYNDYYVQLVIAPGYSSEGITIYPMLTTYEQWTTTYEPCLLSHGYEDRNVETTAYNTFTITKQEYLNLSDEDLRLLSNYARYQTTGQWITIDFMDGTGIYMPQSDTSELQYGEINAIGQLSLLYGDEDSIVVTDLPLHQIKDFVSYLRELNNPDYTILVAIQDDGVLALTDSMMMRLEDLGVQIPLTEGDPVWQRTYYHDSYYAVLNPGEPAVEGASEEELHYTGTTRDGKAIDIVSRGSNTGDSGSSIRIDGAEYGMGRRGMNIVVYDNTLGQVVDQVTFDTNNGLYAYRLLHEAGSETDS